MKIRVTQFSAITAAVITLIFFPINYDALIIPKMAIFFTIAIILIPILIKNIRTDLKDKNIFVLHLIIGIIIVQLVLVMLISPAPFEQEFFGRTGRGLGLITFISFLIFFLANAKFASLHDSTFLIQTLALSGFISSVYALVQQFGWDIFNWATRTNGIIGTLGNPNFQSSFTAMTFAAALIFSLKKSFNLILIIISIIVFTSTLFFTQATQGYLILGTTVLVYLLIFAYYKNRKYFSILSILGVLGIIPTIAGMINMGPLSYYLYKVSVISRGDFWRSAIATAKANPMFGIGLDSFGDYFLKYRDKPKTEMTDNAHNYFLEFAATGGFPLALLYIGLTILTFINFLQLQKKINRFDPSLTAIFCAWIGFQMQSIISPGTITLIAWNSIISGFIIGANYRYGREFETLTKKSSAVEQRISSKLFFIGVVGIVFITPLFNTDRMLMEGVKNKNANLVISALTSYPESSVKYNIFIQELLRSNLREQALVVSQRAAAFNPNAVSAWALIFVNPSAPYEERIKAKSEILRLDPLNTEVLSFELK